MLDSFQGIALLTLFMLMVLGGLRLMDLAEPNEERARRAIHERGEEDRVKIEGHTSLEIERVIEGCDEVATPIENDERRKGFEEQSRKRLDPLLDELVERALTHGHKASVHRDEDEKGVRYRLEVRRKDHPAGQPTPYMTFSVGSRKPVSILWGGDFPGPPDENGHHTEIDWFEADWRDVEKHVLKFAKRVFKSYPQRSSISLGS